MNRTKRKIFEAAMKLFAEKGYDATSVEEITATVGVAKGTLYYHFSSKEEIYSFLIEEGMKLLNNSIEIKTEKLTDPIMKLRAVIIIQLKVIMKYNEFITILLSQIWGNEQRHQESRKYIYEYIDVIQKIIDEGIAASKIKPCDSHLMACSIFGAICAIKLHESRMEEDLKAEDIANDLVNYMLNGMVA
ncbi:MAG: TetR/AcrR family transcriptional regulator [Clostridia bacterium]|nr:TetR/AcrR family transcriptional regulator [Clostridia bacterium]